MSLPNSSTTEPAVIRALEVNGVANIIMHVENAVYFNRPIDTGYIRDQARKFDRYVAKLEAGHINLKWHEHLKEESAC